MAGGESNRRGLLAGLADPFAGRRGAEHGGNLGLCLIIFIKELRVAEVLDD